MLYETAKCCCSLWRRKSSDVGQPRPEGKKRRSHECNNHHSISPSSGTNVLSCGEDSWGSHRIQRPSAEQEASSPEVGWTTMPQTASVWPLNSPRWISGSTKEREGRFHHLTHTVETQWFIHHMCHTGQLVQQVSATFWYQCHNLHYSRLHHLCS